MKRTKKIFLGALSVFLLSGAFATTAHASPIVGDRTSYSITIQLPANRDTWATGARRSTGTSQFVAAWQPAHAIQSRVILGTNASPGATTSWQSHAANQTTTRTHTSDAFGSNVRAQFRTSSSRSSSFTSGGSWTP